MRYLINFSYDGSMFNGYQKQPNLRTVQGCLEDALKFINGGSCIDIHSSGRTDKGVHAYNQYAHFDMDRSITLYKLKCALNTYTPDDIYIKNVRIVDNDFHARYSVLKKEYIYKLNVGEYSPVNRNYVYQYNKKLDLVAMERGLKYLEGEHNFKSFTKSDDDIVDYVRKISTTSIVRDSRDLNKITISFVGTGFLRYMVRNMVGLLIEIGEGKRNPEEVIKILDKEDRTISGKTANPEGLYLKNVFY